MIDTAQGVVLKRDTIEGREVVNVLPPFSPMAVSGDGRALRILIDMPKSTDADSFLRENFDTQTGGFLPRACTWGTAALGASFLTPPRNSLTFSVRTNRVRLIRVDGDSRELQNLDGILPCGKGESARPSSLDGSRIYLGYNRDHDRAYDKRFIRITVRAPNLRPNSATAGEFRVFDTHTWRKIGTIRTKMPFWSAVTANDGKMRYAMAPQKHSILVIDTVKMRQIRVLKKSAERPR